MNLLGCEEGLPFYTLNFKFISSYQSVTMVFIFFPKIIKNESFMIEMIFIFAKIINNENSGGYELNEPWLSVEKQ